jgi:hypothetical protein
MSRKCLSEVTKSGMSSTEVSARISASFRSSMGSSRISSNFWAKRCAIDSSRLVKLNANISHLAACARANHGQRFFWIVPIHGGKSQFPEYRRACEKGITRLTKNGVEIVGEIQTFGEVKKKVGIKSELLLLAGRHNKSASPFSNILPVERRSSCWPVAEGEPRYDSLGFHSGNPTFYWWAARAS